MKYKKVMLINPHPCKNTRGINEATIYPPLGLAYIAAVLCTHNIKVEIIDANILRLDNQKVLELVHRKKPDLVGISLNIVTANSGISLSRSTKETSDSVVCLGGPFVSSVPQNIFRKSKADILVIGEGEQSITDICKGMPLDKIKGVARNMPDGTFILNEPAELIDGLDTIPMPAYDLLPPFRLYRSRSRKLPMAAIFTSRGCPFNCTFCNHNIFGMKFRAFSVKRVLDEIEFLASNYGIKQFDILDDNCAFDMLRFEAILDLIIKKKMDILINLQNGIRVDNLTHTIVKKMKKAGCFKVGIGCESADQETIREIKKSADLEKIRQAVKWFREEDIVTYLFFIIGFPDDTKESVMKSIDFACAADPTGANFSTLVPFPGTEIYRSLKERQLLWEDLDDGIMSGFTGGQIYHACRHLAKKEVLSLQSLAYRKFYLRPGKIADHIRQIRSYSEFKWYFDILRKSAAVLKQF
ncbi:MAG: radical SAM protein [Patescibacteria group bacterium]